MSITDPLTHREIIQRQDEARIQRRVESVGAYEPKLVGSAVPKTMEAVVWMFEDILESGVLVRESNGRVFFPKSPIVVDVTDFEWALPYQFHCEAHVQAEIGVEVCFCKVRLVAGPVRIDERIYCEYEVVDVEVAI